MADTIKFDLVSPERRLASFDATSVHVPAAEGEMTVMAGHAPVIATLRPGIVHVEGSSENADFVVTSGFIEVTGESVSVLAERAFDSAGASRSDIQSVLDEARKQAEFVPSDGKDAADLFVADLVDLLEKMS